MLFSFDGQRVICFLTRFASSRERLFRTLSRICVVSCARTLYSLPHLHTMLPL
jgi:hypothetical protein